MELMTKELEEQIPIIYSQENEGDPIAHCKFFTPDSSWRWFVLEYDPSKRLCFGYVCGMDNELGYFNLDELESVTGPMGLHIERDLHWASRPLSKVKQDVKELSG